MPGDDSGVRGTAPRFPDSLVRQPAKAKLRRPLSRRRAAPHSGLRFPEVRGRGTPGPRGPADLGISRSRGSPDFDSASPPVPQASRARCLRLAPQNPRWAHYRFRPPGFCCARKRSALRPGHLPTALGLRSPRAGIGVLPVLIGQIPRDPGQPDRDSAAWAAGAGRSSGAPHFAFPGHRSRSKATDVAASLDGSRRMEASAIERKWEYILTRM